MTYEIVIYVDAAGEYRWRGEVSNHRILADSGEGYEHLVDLRDALTILFGPEMATQAVRKYQAQQEA